MARIEQKRQIIQLLQIIYEDGLLPQRIAEYRYLLMTLIEVQRTQPRQLEWISSEYFSDKENFVKSLIMDLVPITNIYTHGAIRKLRNEYALSSKEEIMCCYIFWRLSGAECCLIEKYTQQAHYSRSRRLKQRLKVDKDEELSVFIDNYIKKQKL